MPAVTADMSIHDVLELDRTTAQIFTDFGMHCMGCPFAMAESIADAGEGHGIDVEELVKKLNEHLGAKVE